jgi:heme A synthase
MDGMEKGREVRRGDEGEENEQKRNRYALRKTGQLGHTHGELVDFIYWFLTFSFWFFLNSPPPQVQQW